MYSGSLLRSISRWVSTGFYLLSATLLLLACADRMDDSEAIVNDGGGSRDEAGSTDADRDFDFDATSMAEDATSRDVDGSDTYPADVATDGAVTRDAEADSNKADAEAGSVETDADAGRVDIDDRDAPEAGTDGDGSVCPCVDPNAPGPHVYRTSVECYPIAVGSSYAPFAQDPCYPLTMVVPPYYWGQRIDSRYDGENLIGVTIMRSGTATTYYFDTRTETIVGASRSNWTPDPIYCSSMPTVGGTVVSAGMLPTTAATSSIQTCPREGGT